MRTRKRPAGISKECAARFPSSNSMAGTAFPRRGRAGVTWTPSIAGSSEVFTRWRSLSAPRRCSKKRFDSRAGLPGSAGYPRFQFLDAAGFRRRPGTGRLESGAVAPGEGLRLPRRRDCPHPRGRGDLVGVWRGRGPALAESAPSSVHSTIARSTIVPKARSFMAARRSPLPEGLFNAGGSWELDHLYGRRSRQR